MQYCGRHQRLSPRQTAVFWITRRAGSVWPLLWSPGSRHRPGVLTSTSRRPLSADLQPQSLQAKAGNILVFLGRQATDTNPSHDRASAGVHNDESALDGGQVRIPHFSNSTALALQALSIGEGVLA